MFKAKKLLFAALLSLLGLAAPQTARAQYIGNVGLQTSSAVLLANAPCTSTIPAVVPNLGQMVHSVSYTTTGNPTSVALRLEGSFDGVGFVTISDTATRTSGTITALGYWPLVRLNVLGCLGGTSPTISAKYNGSPVSPSFLLGDSDLTIYEKTMFIGQSGGSSANAFDNQTLPLAFGNTAGVIAFSSSGTLAAGSTITVFASYDQGPTIQIASFALPVSLNATAYFQVPEGPAQGIGMTFNSGGASAATFNAVYFMRKPGFYGIPGQSNYGTHITGTTATSIKSAPGFLHTLTINTGAAGTVSVFDLNAGACTGTPATNTLAVITATTTTTQTFSYDVNVVNGLCVKASVAMDLTVSSD